MIRPVVTALAVATALLLTGCSEETPLVVGEVVSCDQIEVIENPSDVLNADCLDGSTGVNIAAIKGPAIINVWGSWCDPCREELIYFSEFFQSKDSRIHLIGVDVEEKQIEDGRKFARSHGVTWPNLYDEDGSTRKYFGMGVPVTWFIGSDGEVLYKKIGPIKSTEELRTLSDKYFGME